MINYRRLLNSKEYYAVTKKKNQVYKRKNTVNRKDTLDYKNRSSRIPDTVCKASMFIKFK